MLSADKEVDVSVIVPAYNEEARIGAFLDSLINFISGSPVSFEIVVVADGCTDATEKLVNKYSETFLGLRLISFPQRLGKGGAIKRGFQNSRGRLFLYIDADGGYNPKEIPHFLQVLDKADCAVGSRTFKGAVLKTPPPKHRMIAGYFFMRLVNLFLLQEIKDTQAGFKAFKREVIEKIFPQVYTNGFDVDVQLLVRAKKSGFKLTQLPVTYRFLRGSKVRTLRDGLIMGLSIFQFWFRLLLERLGLCQIPNGERLKRRQ